MNQVCPGNSLASVSSQSLVVPLNSLARKPLVGLSQAIVELAPYPSPSASMNQDCPGNLLASASSQSLVVPLNSLARKPLFGRVQAVVELAP